MKISVVIPVYNVEEYVYKCLESVRLQTVKPGEVIIVNDGSTDNSLKIIEDYIKEFNLDFRVITQTNGGMSHARNTALKFVTSEYVTFLDSDDYLEITAIERYLQIFENEGCDVVVCNYAKVNESHQIIEHMSGGDFVKVTGTSSIPFKITPAVWNKCFKRSLFDDLEFKVGLRYEDLALVPIVLSKAEAICKVEDELYFYLKRSGNNKSVMQKVDDKLFDLYKALDVLYDYFGESYKVNLITIYINHLLIYNIGLFLKHENGINNLAHNVAIIDAKFPNWVKVYNRSDFLLLENFIILLYRLRLLIVIKFLYRFKRK